MKKFYKARAWLVDKLGGVMKIETLNERRIIREFEHPVEKVRAIVVLDAIEVQFVQNIDEFAQNRLIGRLVAGLKERDYISFRQKDLPDGSREYTADLYAARVNEDN